MEKSENEYSLVCGQVVIVCRMLRCRMHAELLEYLDAANKETTYSLYEHSSVSRLSYPTC